MANLAKRRIQRELLEFHKSIEKDRDEQIQIEESPENFTILKGTIVGPPDTPYESGKFNLEIIIPENYPFSPPKVKFITRIWHPNISSATGVICLDILKDQWAAAMSLRTMLLSVQALLAAPEPDDPQDAVVANQYRSNRSAFEITARHWASVYAQGPRSVPDCEGKIEKLVQMGFDETDSRVALSMSNWDIPTATEHLLK